MNLRRFPAGSGEVALLATVQGLVSERERARHALGSYAPDVVALGLSPEAAASLLAFERPEDFDPFDELPDHDYVYSVVLRAFGDVDLPPPDLVEAARWAKERGATYYGVDLPEEEYETLYTRSVSTWQFLRVGRIQRRLARRPPRVDGPRALALAWDAAMRKVKGIATIEAARERRMAEAAARLAGEGKRVLLLVDVAREAGVATVLAQATRPP